MSPPLKWKGVPTNTESFVLIMEDPDTPVGTITNWVMYNIPSKVRKLKENIPHKKKFSNGVIQGRNSRRKNHYMGPCPPFGEHRYVFKLYALDTKLNEDTKIKELLKKMEGHLLDQAELMGRYSK